MKFVKVILLNLILFGFIQCAQNTLKKESILGAWEITSAERNAKITETLNGAYFEFDDQGMMTTNLLGREESTPFDFNEQSGQILQIGNNNLIFAITYCENNNLGLETSIKDIPFILKLHKIDNN